MFFAGKMYKNFFLRVLNTFYLGNIFHDKSHFSRELKCIVYIKILLKCQTLSLETRSMHVFTSLDKLFSDILYFQASCPWQMYSFSVYIQ